MYKPNTYDQNVIDFLLVFHSACRKVREYIIFKCISFFTSDIFNTLFFFVILDSYWLYASIDMFMSYFFLFSSDEIILLNLVKLWMGWPKSFLVCIFKICTFTRLKFQKKFIIQQFSAISKWVFFLWYWCVLLDYLEHAVARGRDIINLRDILAVDLDLEVTVADDPIPTVRCPVADVIPVLAIIPNRPDA